MFLEGMWNYTFYKGEDPMGATVAENLELYDTILLNTTDSIQDKASVLINGLRLHLQ